MAFLTFFGLVWWLAGVSALGAGFWPAAALAGCVVAAGVWRTGRGLRNTGRTSLPADVRRRFIWMNMLQWLAIALVAAGARVVGVPELIPGLVAVVVGFHFLPLAALFRQPRFHLTGALMITAGVAGCALEAIGGPTGSGQTTVGLGAAVILWGTACLAQRGPAGPADHPGTEGHSQTT
ncbi:hypothetical protein E4N62_44880 [Streptomyces sp. MNU76]|uniref:hypothetical protein n=1 Tax=Streptomyces sp. MNU76 TaxID=2560026 RepID=UPI001E3605D4|nr:hypothetical protein [Streptomyces sp. MNU76]MCC9711728.1 hypothetical protein [Streptomyces sp. MNU76]